MQTTGLIGLGRWGKNLARNYFELGSLRAICDLDPVRLDAFKQDFPGVTFTTEKERLINDPEIKRVVIATNSKTHAHFVEEALIKGKDVYVEKPFCFNSEEAKRLVLLAKRMDAILMVGHLLHYHPCIEKIKELVKEGAFGQLHYIDTSRLNLTNAAPGEKALWDLGSHDLSVIIAICGLPREIFCKGADETSVISMSFNDDLQAHVHVSLHSPFREQKLVIIGSKGRAIFDDTKEWGKKLIFIEEVGKNEGKPQKLDPPKAEPLRRECEHFLKCCATREQPLTSGEEGLRVVQLIENLEKSTEQAAPVLLG